jgi:hypothetical protein
MSGSGEKSEDKRRRLDKLGGSLSNLIYSNIHSRGKKAKGVEGLFKKSSSQDTLPVPTEMEQSECVSVADSPLSEPVKLEPSRETRRPDTIQELKKNLAHPDVNYLYSGDKTLLQLALYHLNQQFNDTSDSPDAANQLKSIIISLLQRPFTKVTNDDWRDISELIINQDLENLYSELTKLSNTNSSKSSSSSSRLFPAAPEYPVLRYLTQWHSSVNDPATPYL